MSLDESFLLFPERVNGGDSRSTSAGGEAESLSVCKEVLTIIQHRNHHMKPNRRAGGLSLRQQMYPARVCGRLTKLSWRGKVEIQRTGE